MENVFTSLCVSFCLGFPRKPESADFRRKLKYLTGLEKWCLPREKINWKKKHFTYIADFVPVSKQVVDINYILSCITCHLGFINSRRSFRFDYLPLEVGKLRQCGRTGKMVNEEVKGNVTSTWSIQSFSSHENSMEMPNKVQSTGTLVPPHPRFISGHFLPTKLIELLLTD